MTDQEQPRSPILAALYQGRQDLAEEVLATDPPLDGFESAAVDREEELAELLVADPDLPSKLTPDGFTALHLAAFFGGNRTARLLLEHGADPMAVADNTTRVQPLHSAVAGRHVEIVRLLLDAGADPGPFQRGGITPLMAAAHVGHEELVRMLLDAGADPTAASDDDTTARGFAERDGHARVVGILAEAETRAAP